MGHDEVMPEGKWEFDASVTEVFDDMLSRSIPQYDVMRKACTDFGARFVHDGATIVDMGCSRGEALAPFVDKFGLRCRYVGLEVSPAMLEASRKRFGSLAESNIVSVREWDLRGGLPPVRAALILSVLTVQFTPIEYRPKIIRSVYESLEPGGAFVLVEKVLGNSAALDAGMVDVYYALKAEHGYSQQQIERKRLSLEGVLVPITAKWNEDLLRTAGFDEIDCFWRWMNFAAWVARRQPADGR